MSHTLLIFIDENTKFNREKTLETILNMEGIALRIYVFDIF